MTTDSYDIVVLGGGVAGCALASRLSEDGGRSVRLAEAGADYGHDPGGRPAGVRDAPHRPSRGTSAIGPGAPCHGSAHRGDATVLDRRLWTGGTARSASAKRAAPGRAQ
ncbi:hypothetical protein [Streptomyces enissocaesilis]|uniref:FAD dependent oxidoreductase domain-containing protein n=1 Tax=Streptomyces enissocaesilis TaxID=332589 RepID=A0ABP6JMN9_9ACTN